MFLKLIFHYNLYYPNYQSVLLHPGVLFLCSLILNSAGHKIIVNVLHCFCHFRNTHTSIPSFFKNSLNLLRERNSIDFTLFSLSEYLSAISLIVSKNQYLRRNTLRSSSFSLHRKELISFPSSSSSMPGAIL